MNKSENIAALAAALSKCQGALSPAKKDSENPHFKSKYADLSSLWDAAQKPLCDNGLAVVQCCDIPESGQGVIIETVLTHSSGEWMSGRLFLPAGRFDPQGVGSAITYARRYAFAAMIGLVSDEDDDANGAMASQKKPAQKPAAKPERPAGDTAAKPGPTEAQSVKLLDLCTALVDEQNPTPDAVLEVLTGGKCKTLAEIATHPAGWTGAAIGKAEALLKAATGG